jgi:hypothetical protein
MSAKNSSESSSKQLNFDDMLNMSSQRLEKNSTKQVNPQSMAEENKTEVVQSGQVDNELIKVTTETEESKNQSAEQANAKFSKTEIRKRIKEHPELKYFIPPLNKIEKQQLRISIQDKGCQVPLVLWRQQNVYYIVDGYNRYEICKDLKIKFRFEVKEFDSLESVKEFMLENQLGRRNLTNSQACYLRGKMYNILKKKTANLENLKQHKSENGFESQALDANNTEDDKLSLSKNTAKKLAKNFGVSYRTVQREGQIAEALDLIAEKNYDLRMDILTGKKTVKKSDLRIIGEKLEKASGFTFENITDIKKAAGSLSNMQTGSDNNFPNALSTLDILRYVAMIMGHNSALANSLKDETKALQTFRNKTVEFLESGGKQEEAKWVKKCIDKEIKKLLKAKLAANDQADE